MSTTTLTTTTTVASTTPTTTLKSNGTMKTTLNPTTNSEAPSTFSIETTQDNISSFSTTSDLTTQSTSSTEGVPKPDEPMSVVSLVGVIAGSIVGVFVIILIGVFIYRRRKRKRSKRRENPVMPSAADVKTFKSIHDVIDVPIDVIDVSSDVPSTENEPSGLYQNIDQSGKPSDKTNPNVAEDGYLKKTATGVSYSNEGQDVGKKNKKKIKNKFEKKKKKRAEHNDAFSPAQGLHDLGEGSRDNKTGSTVSDIGYSEGRAAGEPIGAGNASVINEGHYANLQTNKEQDDYYNVNTGKLYENIRGGNS